MCTLDNFRVVSQLWICSILLLCSDAYGQTSDILNGYYSTPKGDSIYGQFHVGELKQSVLRFRTSNHEKWSYLPIEEVSKAQLENGQLILPQEVRLSERSEKILISEVVHGNYSLYQGYLKSGTAIFFAKVPASNAIVKINPLGYRQQLKTILGKCAEGIRFNRVHYDLASLTNIFFKINNCSSPVPAKVSKHFKLRPRVGVGAGFAYYHIEPKIGELYGHPSYFSKNYATLHRATGMATLKVNLTRIFTLNASVLYVDKYLHGDTVFNRLPYTRDVPGLPVVITAAWFQFSSRLNFSYLEFPIGLSANILPRAKYSPFITLGIAPRISINSEMENEWGCPGGRPCNTDKVDPELLASTGATAKSTSPLSYFTGVGMRGSLKKRSDLEFRIDFFGQAEKATINTNNANPSSVLVLMKTPRLQISASYFYYLN